MYSYTLESESKGRTSHYETKSDDCGEQWEFQVEKHLSIDQNLEHCTKYIDRVDKLGSSTASWATRAVLVQNVIELVAC